MMPRGRLICFLNVNLEVKLLSSFGRLFHMGITWYTERNKWYILTHLGESGYCLQINQNYQVNWPNSCKFSGQWPRSLWNPRRWKSQFTTQPATQFTVLYHWEVSVRISLWHCIFMEICLIFYSYYFVTYIHHVGYVCSVRISKVL